MGSHFFRFAIKDRGHSTSINEKSRRMALPHRKEYVYSTCARRLHLYLPWVLFVQVQSPWAIVRVLNCLGNKYFVLLFSVVPRNALFSFLMGVWIDIMTVLASARNRGKKESSSKRFRGFRWEPRDTETLWLYDFNCAHARSLRRLM